MVGPTSRRLLPLQIPTVIIGGREIDPCQIISPMEVTIGRSDASEQPSAPSATIDLLGLPAGIAIGDDVSIAIRPDRSDIWSDIWSDQWSEDATPPDDVWSDVWTDMWSPDASLQPRMAGRVSDIQVERDGPLTTTRIIVSGRTAGLAGRIGAQPWPAQTEAARVAAVAAAAGIPIQCQPAETHNVIRLDVDSRSALDVLHQMAAGCGAILTEDPDGTIWYQPLGWRERTDPPALLLADCDILDDVGWEADAPTTRAIVSYGYQPEGGGDRPEVQSSDPAAEVALGVHQVRVASDYSSESAARGVAAHIVRSRAWGQWSAPMILLPLHLLPSLAAYRETVALLRPGARIETIGVPYAPSGDRAVRCRWVVEGWRESWSRDGDHVLHDMQVAVSPAGPWPTPRAVSLALAAEYVPHHPEGPRLHIQVAAGGLGQQQPRPRIEVSAGGSWIAGGPADYALDVWVPVRPQWRGRRLPVVASTPPQPGWRPAVDEVDVWIPGV